MEKKLIKQIIIPLFIAILSTLLIESQRYDYIYDSKFLRGLFDVFPIFVFPILPIIYGRITKDKIGSILMGVLPLSGFFILMLLKEIAAYGFIRQSPDPIFLIILIIGGLEGYFASKRNKPSLSIAIGLYILFIVLFILACLN